MSISRQIRLWAPVLGFMLVLFWASGQPGEELPPLPWDKLVHATAFTVFGMLCLRATHGGSGPLERGAAAGALAVALAYAAADEWHQSFVPGRQSSLGDWVADAIGAVLAVGLWHARYGSRKHSPDLA